MSESSQPLFTKTRILAIIAAIVAVLGIVTAFLTSGDAVVETPVVVEEAPVVAPVAPETVVVPVSEENPTPALEIPVAPAPAE